MLYSPVFAGNRLTTGGLVHVFDTDLIRTAAAVIEHRGETVLLVQRGMLTSSALFGIRRALAGVTVVPTEPAKG